jgi:hypothetical protein
MHTHIHTFTHKPTLLPGESGELGRAIKLDLKEAAEEAGGEKPEYDLYRIWKEHLTPVRGGVEGMGA